MFVPLTINRTTAVVTLTRGKRALIDAADWPRVSEYKWHAHPVKTRWYAARNGSKSEPRTVYLHRELCGEPADRWVDHWNRKTLDDRRQNLRVCTPADNCRNSSPRGGESRFHGVTLDKRRVDGPSPYLARIRILGKRICVGTYATEEDAARAYDAKARELHGEFASLNFPPPARATG